MLVAVGGRGRTTGWLTGIRVLWHLCLCVCTRTFDGDKVAERQRLPGDGTRAMGCNVLFHETALVDVARRDCDNRLLGRFAAH